VRTCSKKPITSSAKKLGWARVSGLSGLASFCANGCYVLDTGEPASTEKSGRRFLPEYLESVLFIGTQFSNLYTAVDTPARGRVCVCVVFVCKYVLGHSRVSQPLHFVPNPNVSMGAQLTLTPTHQRES